MPTLIDTSLWVDFTRTRSPRELKRFIAPYILDPGAHVAEPIAFEILRHATASEVKQLTQQFQSLPTLATPPTLWIKAAELGQACRQKNGSRRFRNGENSLNPQKSKFSKPNRRPNKK